MRRDAGVGTAFARRDRMMNAGEFCNRTVVFVHPGDPVTEAARLMREHHVGDVVVVEEAEGKRRPIGVLTDRDIVVSVIAKAPDFVGSLAVGEVMNDTLVTADEDDPLWDVLKRMRTAGVRRVPVVDRDGVLLGIVTFDDLVEFVASELNDLSTLLSREQAHEMERRS
jgi:CBS domain-containing protein